MTGIRIGSSRHNDSDVIVLSGKTYMVISHSSSHGYNSAVLMDEDGTEVAIQTTPCGKSIDEATERITGVRRRRSVSFDKFDGIKLEEGGLGKNLFGTYIIMEINEANRMRIRYEEGLKRGLEQELDVAGQAEHMHKERLRELSKAGVKSMNLCGGSNSFAMGYLAKHALLECGIQSDQTESIGAAYEQLSLGDKLNNHFDNGYWIRKTYNSWGWFKVTFSPPPAEVLELMSSFIAKHNPISGDGIWGGMQINRKDFFFNLVGYGFRIGKSHDVARIRSSVSDQDAFDKGFNYEIQEAATEETELMTA